MIRAARRSVFAATAAAAAVVVATSVRAEDAEEAEEAEEARTAVEAPDRAVSDTPADPPRPGEAHGIAVARSEPVHALLWIPRVVLAPVRLALIAATEPLYQLGVLNDRYRIQQRVVDFLFNDERTFGVFPTAFFETGFGFNVGARLVHTDFFGRGEGLNIRAGYGGTHRQKYELGLHSGERFASARVFLRTGFDARNNNRFYGIGNAEEQPLEQIEPPLEGTMADVATRTRFRSSSVWGLVGLGHELSRGLALRLTHRWRKRWLAEGDPTKSETPWLSDVYVQDTVSGYPEEPLVDAYTELRLSYRKREVEAFPLPPALPSEGWRFDVWAGWQQGLDGDFGFAPVGVDIQPFFNLFGGDRVLRLRLRVAAAIASYGRIPFLDMPELGGSLLLRGYDRDRFRDRLAILTTAEYRYPVQPNVAAFVFVDAGRVYSDLGSLGVGGARVGVGGGLLAFTRSAFLLRLQVAASVEGNVEVHAKMGTSDALGETN